MFKRHSEGSACAQTRSETGGRSQAQTRPLAKTEDTDAGDDSGVPILAAIGDEELIVLMGEGGRSGVVLPSRKEGPGEKRVESTEPSVKRQEKKTNSSIEYIGLEIKGKETNCWLGKVLDPLEPMRSARVSTAFRIVP